MTPPQSKCCAANLSIRVEEGNDPPNLLMVTRCTKCKQRCSTVELEKVNCKLCQFEPRNGHAQTCPKYQPREWNEPQKDWRVEFDKEFPEIKSAQDRGNSVWLSSRDYSDVID